MAEETIDIPMTPEKIELAGDHTRRNLNGNLSISKSGAKVPPHYLSASTGSCHDLCKYGTKHVLDKKAMSPIPKRNTRRPGEGQEQVKDVIIEERKKKSVTNPKPLPDSKIQTTDKHQIIQKNAPASTKKVAVSSKYLSSPGVHSKHQIIKKKAPASAKNLAVSSKYFSSTGGRVDISATIDLRPKPVRTENINKSKEMRMPKLRKVKDLVPPTVSLSPRSSIKRALTPKSGNSNDSRKVSHLKSQNNVRKAKPKQPIEEEVPEKTLYVIETKLENPTQNVSDTTSLPLSSFPDGNGQNGMHCSGSPPSSGNKKLRHVQNATQTTRSSSSSSLPSPTRSVEIEPISKGSGTKIQNSTPRRVGLFNLKDKLGSPQKLNFRRGKVVDVPSKNTSASRLAFKQRRVLGENQNGKADTEQSSLKKVDSINELNDSKSESMKVALRHQAVEGKRSSQSLFNNVIEETASKLVQARKSKVKALVGAFETVISLQDSKSTAATSMS